MDYTNENLEIYQRIICSSLGAIVTSFIVTPLDVIKTRIQTNNIPSFNDEFIHCNKFGGHLCLCASRYSKLSRYSIQTFKIPNHFHNSSDVFRKIVKTEGVKSLWSGLSPTLIMTIPQVVIYYTLNDWLKSVSGYTDYQKDFITSVKDNTNSFTRGDMVPPMCGAIARFVAQVTIAPLELMRTKMQSQKLSYSQMTNVTRKAIRQGGWSVMWRGIGPTMWRDVPYTVTLWFIYEYLKKRHLQLTRSRSNDSEHTNLSLPRHLTFVYSACGAIVAGIISHPFDVIKTHRQVQLGDTVTLNKSLQPLSSSRTPSSTWLYLNSLRNSQGYAALFSGFYPRIIRVVIATSTMITIFESMKTFFLYCNQQHQHQRRLTTALFVKKDYF